MTARCPRHGEITPGRLYAGFKGEHGQPIWCLEGPLGDPCGERVLEPEAKKPPPQKAWLGRGLEDACEAGARIYMRLGHAVVRKVPATWQRTKHGYVRVSAKEPDFIGTVRGGRGLKFDAKSTVEERLDLVDVRPVQRKALGDLDRMGGIAGLVVELDSRGEAPVWWVPWSKVVEFEATETRKSLPRAWIEANGVRIERKGKALMWLGAVEGMGV